MRHHNEHLEQVLEVYQLKNIKDHPKLIQKEAISITILLSIVVPLMIMISQIVISYYLSKRNKTLEKSIQRIMKSSKWKVRILDINVPNAFSFAMGVKHIFITKELIKITTNREAIAILLHEASHTITFDSLQNLAGNTTLMVLAFKVATKAALRFSSLLDLVLILIGLLLMANTTFVVNRVLGRYQENKADSFAAKMGYGDEMISALKKLEKYIQTLKSKCKTLFCRASDKVEVFMDEHPSFDNRIKNVLQELEKFKKMNHKQIKSRISDIMQSGD